MYTYFHSAEISSTYVPSTIYQNSVKKYLATSYFRFLYRSSKIKEKCLNYFKYEIRKYSIERQEKEKHEWKFFKVPCARNDSGENLKITHKISSSETPDYIFFPVLLY